MCVLGISYETRYGTTPLKGKLMSSRRVVFLIPKDNSSDRSYINKIKKSLLSQFAIDPTLLGTLCNVYHLMKAENLLRVTTCY